jgi:hypothetical protein
MYVAEREAFLQEREEMQAQIRAFSTERETYAAEKEQYIAQVGVAWSGKCGSPT